MRIPAARTLPLALALALAAAGLLAPQAPAAPAVPAPESVLGFVPGEDRKLADWGQVLAYLRHRLPGETFQKFTMRHDLNTLQAIFSNEE